MAYDKNTDYQAKINEAVAKGDTALAAKYESQRNEKIADMNKSGTNTGGYKETNTYNKAPAGYAGSTTATGSVSQTVQDIINKMNQNSQLWYTDPANRAIYEQQNQALGQQLNSVQEKGVAGTTTYGANYDATSGKWTVAGNYTQDAPKAPVTTNNTQAALIGQNLGDIYGLTYDMNQIKNILDKATRAEYAAKMQGYQTTENNMYNQISGLQNTSLDTIRRANAAAVATGASKGLSAANELSAILGFQQDSSVLANDLANQRTKLVADEAAAYTKNASTALDNSNAIKQAVAGLDLTKYGYDTQGHVGELDYLAALQQVLASKYASDQTLAGVKYNADSNLAAAQAAAAKYSYNSTNSDSYTNDTTDTKTDTKTNNTKDTTPAGQPLGAALQGLNGLITDGNGSYMPTGQSFTITGDNTKGYTVSGIVDPAQGNSPVTTTLTAAQMQQLIANNWQLGVLTQGNYGAENYTPKPKVTSVKEAQAYFDNHGVEPSGWKRVVSVGGGGAAAVGWEKVTATPVAITGTQGQQISINGTVWTYNATTKTWSRAGNIQQYTMNQFKSILDQNIGKDVKVVK